MKVFTVVEGRVVNGECCHGYVPKDGGDPVVCEGFEWTQHMSGLRMKLGPYMIQCWDQVLCMDHEYRL